MQADADWIASVSIIAPYITGTVDARIQGAECVEEVQACIAELFACLGERRESEPRVRARGRQLVDVLA